MKVDPLDEVRYRRLLAEGYLRDAERCFSSGDWRGTVANAQLAVENAAKAVIAVYAIPSWTHDPSPELLGLMDRMPEELRGLVEELAGIAHELAPEHGRVTYGDPARGLTPWELYDAEYARRVLQKARKGVELMRLLLSRLLGGLEARESS